MQPILLASIAPVVPWHLDIGGASEEVESSEYEILEVCPIREEICEFPFPRIIVISGVFRFLVRNDLTILRNLAQYAPCDEPTTEQYTACFAVVLSGASSEPLSR